LVAQLSSTSAKIQICNGATESAERRASRKDNLPKKRISGYVFYTSFDLAYHCFSGLRFWFALAELDLVKAQQFAPIEVDALISDFHRGRFLAISRIMVNPKKFKSASSQPKPRASRKDILPEEKRFSSRVFNDL